MPKTKELARPRPTGVRQDEQVPRHTTGTSAATAPEKPQYRIWVLHCPFRKNGMPVMGSFGALERPVVIIPLDTWKRLCADVPQLQTTQFEVGSYE